MDDNEAISLLESIENDLPETFLLKLKPVIQSTYLPELKFGEERPLEEADFVNLQVLIHKNIKTLALIFKELNEQIKSKKELQVDVETVQDIVLLCGEHTNEELWTTKEILESAQILLNVFVKFLNFECFTKLLFEFKGDFISTLFVKLRPKLLKDRWKRYPAAVGCYRWLLFHIKSPHLSTYFDTVLPTALIILDDHVFHNRIIGMQCIEHIVNNVTRTELNWYGRETLLYKALEPMVYFREPELLPTLTSCLIALLRKTENDPSGLNLKWSHFDDVLNIWLPGMEMEQKIASRIINLECLSNFLLAAGLISVRWSRKLFNIFTEYSAEKNTCEKSLQTLLVFIEVAWPRIQNHCGSIFVILMKVAMDLPELEDNSGSSKIVPLLKTCLHKLKQLVPDQINKLCDEVSESDELKAAYCILSS